MLDKPANREFLAIAHKYGKHGSKVSDAFYQSIHFI